MFLNNNFVFFWKNIYLCNKKKFILMIINIENLKSFTSTSLEVNSGADCITIYNSHIITDKDDMKRILVEIANKTQNKEFAIHQRTMNSMLEEWHHIIFYINYVLIKQRKLSLDYNILI